MTLIDLRRMNTAWSEDDFLDVYTVADFLSDGECAPQHLRLRFAMSLYGSCLVKRFNACTVWVE